MLRIKDLSLGSKISLIVLTLILSVIYFAYQEIEDGLDELNESKKLYHEVMLSEVLSDVIHEIQRERGLSVLYTSSSRVKLRIELMEQQKIVDSKIKNFQNLIANENRFTNISILFNSYQVKREAVMTFSDSPSNIAEYFANVTHELLAYMELLRSNIKDITLKNKLKAHINLLFAKEYLALIRSILNEDLSREGTTIQNYSRFSLNKGKYDFNVMRLRNSSEKEVIEYYDNKMHATSARIVHDTIDKIFRFNTIEKTPLAYAEWWRLSSETIDFYHQVEIFSLDLIKSHVQERIIVLESIVKNIIFSIVFIILFLIVITLLFIKYISQNIIHIQNAAKNLAMGDINVELKIDTKDEMGSLANSFKSIISFTEEYANLADEIGKGNYNVAINVKSEKDILGKSLVTMRDNLRNLKEKEFNQLWINNGLNEISKITREEQQIEPMAENTLNFLVKYLNSIAGTFYILTDDRDEGPLLRLASSYAFNNKDKLFSEINLGEGIVGQCGYEKQPIILSDIPENYLKIYTSIGEVIPKNTIAIPLTSNGNLKGVIELATFENLDSGRLEFIRELSEALGVSIEILQRKLQTERLLKEANQLSEELKKQTEELASQQEELRQTNEALFNQTQRLQASEEELEDANMKLEEKARQLEEKNVMVEGKNKELEIAKNELEMSSRFKSEFLANMSHELRTPLNSILILAKLLSDGHDSNLSAKQKEFASVIHKSGNDLLNLINDVLDLSKIESGKTEFIFEKIKTEEVVNDMKMFFSEMANIKQIKFSISKDENCPEKIFTDKIKLEQIIKNLLSNSFKFTDNGGEVHVNILCKKNNEELKDIIKSDSVLEICVSDTGIGITEDKQKIIFDAFKQADGSTNRKYGGTGLGLSISRKLAILLGGDIKLKSTPNEGSAFFIYLPLKTLDNETLSGFSDDINNNEDEMKKILIIEDDTSFSNTILEFSRKNGYKGIIANNGEEGIECAKVYKPDAIILDMNLPLINGWNVLKEIKTDNELKAIPVHVMNTMEKSVSGNVPTKQVSAGTLEMTFEKIRKDILQNIPEVKEKLHNYEKFDISLLKNKKVLIVDDDMRNAFALKNALEDNEMIITIAVTGLEALEILDNYLGIDVVLMDIMLPEMDGFEAIKRIRSDKKFKKLPVIALTAKAMKGDREKIMEAGASDYISKPVEIEKLISLMKHWLKK